MRYGSAFYARQMGTSEQSARVVLPLIFELLRPASVVDFGCGVGTWLSVARELGAGRVAGLDGGYVDRKLLKIAPEEFRPADLEHPAPVTGFDLAMSLEVAEHLSPLSAPRLVDALTGSADAVLFGAAVPGQQGKRHVNCQWQSWWAELFAQRGFLAFDPLRPTLWRRDDVSFWYQQNANLYLRRSRYEGSALTARLKPITELRTLDVVHPKLYESYVRKYWKGPRGWLRRLLALTRRPGASMWPLRP